MFRYALKSLRANLTRLVATALAVIIGITFLASGLMLTDAMRAGLTGDVEQQYAAVDLAITPNESTDFGQIATVPAEVLDLVRAIDGVDAAAGQIQSSATVLRPDGTTANLRSQGRAWIEDDQLNPLQLDEGTAPSGEGEVVLDRKLADEAEAGIGDTVQLETPIGRTEATVVGISRFGDQDSLDDGGTISFDESDRRRGAERRRARLLLGAGAHLGRTDERRDRPPAGAARIGPAALQGGVHR